MQAAAGRDCPEGNLEEGTEMTKQRDALHYRRATCCWSRMGVPKHRWGSREEAQEHTHGGIYEPYECEQFWGQWHVRSKRK